MGGNTCPTAYGRHGSQRGDSCGKKQTRFARHVVWFSTSWRFFTCPQNDGGLCLPRQAPRLVSAVQTHHGGSHLFRGRRPSQSQTGSLGSVCPRQGARPVCPFRDQTPGPPAPGSPWGGERCCASVC